MVFSMALSTGTISMIISMQMKKQKFHQRCSSQLTSLTTCWCKYRSGCWWSTTMRAS